MHSNDLVSKDELHAIVCENIKKFRKESGMTQAELAEKINITHDYLRRLESTKGQKDFTFYTLYKIALILGIPLDDFIVHDGDDKQTKKDDA